MTSDNAQMIEQQIAGRGVSDPRVLAALRTIDRAEFVPPALRGDAYCDSPLEIGAGQTISQPFIVGLMTELLRLEPTDRVLEIGTGSGYQTAVLATLAARVYSSEIEPVLAGRARVLLAKMGINNVEFRLGDGITVFRDQAPFDAILSAAAPEKLPEALIDQLAEGGRCVIPTGGLEQELWLIEKRGGQISRRSVLPVKFVPLRSYDPK